jgi:RecB family exonuclease
MKYVSASQITQYLDCPRKWYFQNVLKMRQPPTPALTTGTAYHKEVEEYITEGKPPTFASIVAGLRAPLAETIEVLKFNVAVEKPLEETGVKIAGVAIKGFVDLSGFCDSGMLNVVDYKTTSDMNRALTPEGLLSNAQLLLYAHVLAVEYGYIGPVRLCHVYLSTKSNECHAVSTVVIFEQVEAAILKMSEVVEAMKADAAKEIHQVYPQKTARGKFGGCHLLQRCTPVIYQPEGKLSVFSNGERNMIKPTRPKNGIYEIVLDFERDYQHRGDAGSEKYWAEVDALCAEHGEELIESLRDRAFD